MGVLLNSPQDEPALKSNEVEVERVTGWLRAWAMGITLRLSSDYRTDTSRCLRSQEGAPPLAWTRSSKPRSRAGPFLWPLLHPCSPDKEIFEHMLPIHRRERMLADPAMD